MENFTAHRLTLRGKVKSTISLNEHKGSALRGAFFHSLRKNFCVRMELDSCLPCQLNQACAICSLVATVDLNGPRGVDVPRPFTLEAPFNGKCTLDPGADFDFGCTIFSQAMQLFPYAILAFKDMADNGIGKRVGEPPFRGRRGGWEIQEIIAHNPLTGEEKLVHQSGDGLVHIPDVPITYEQVLTFAATLPTDRITLRLLTPMRLVSQERVIKKLTFTPLIQRLFERLSALSQLYSDTKLELDFKGLIEASREVAVIKDNTRWVELESFSTRRKCYSYIGGYVGEITFGGNLKPFLPWLVWGMFTHVGKEATKGNGWYEICPP